MVYLVRSVAQTRHDIEKRFSVPIQGVNNKAFPTKTLAFKCLTSAISIVHNDIFIFANVMRISLAVPSITIVLSMGS